MLIIINPIIFSYFVVGLVILVKKKPRETQRPMDGWMDGSTVESRVILCLTFATIREAKQITIFKLEVNDFVLLSCYLLL